MLKLDFFYFKRFLKLTLLIQSVNCITFALLQMPHFLRIIQGVEFQIYNISLILILRVLEWFSFLATVSLICSVFWIFSQDFNEGLESFLIQAGKKVSFIVRPVFFTCAVFSGFFFLFQGWLVPSGTYFLKETLFNLAKEKVISNLRPKHILDVKGWQCCINKKDDFNNLEGVMLNQQKPAITVFINHAKMESEFSFVKMMLNEGIGKLDLPNKKVLFHFESGEILLSIDFKKAGQNKRYANFFKVDFVEKAKRLLFSLTILFLPFFALTFLNKVNVLSVISAFAFVLMIFSSLEILPFNLFVFSLLSAIVYFIYRKEVC